MIDWVHDSRDPNQSLSLQVGPGTFELPPSSAPRLCTGQDDWTISGAGANATLFIGGMEFKDCDNITVRDLTVRIPRWHDPNIPGGANTAVRWSATGEDLATHAKRGEPGGRSFWYNVIMQGGLYAWYDTAGQHYLFSSRAEAQTRYAGGGGGGNTVGFISQDGDVWFYGGEVLMLHNGTGSYIGATGVSAAAAHVRLFGTAIRVFVDDGASSIPSSPHGISGMTSYGGDSEIHAHGSIVNVTSELAGQTIHGARTDASFSVLAFDRAFIHTPGTAFVLKPASGAAAIRLEVGTNTRGDEIQAPFFWPASEVEPAAESLHGQDAFVDTDADGTGKAHLMIYDSLCTGGPGGPWRDMVDGLCRLSQP